MKPTPTHVNITNITTELSLAEEQVRDQSFVYATMWKVINHDVCKLSHA